MNGIINNGGLNAGRKGMKMRHKLEIVFLIFMITVAALGCIESQKLPDSNETKIATPEPTPEQKLPAYNETKPLKINDTFETWSRGYTASYNEGQPYFRVITNHNEWIKFLTDQRYFKGLAEGGRPMNFMLEGELFPGIGVIPKTINPDDFKDYFTIAAMMGLRGKTGPEIEIKNISRINNTVNVTVRMYEPTAGAAAMSSPYHIVIVKRELLPLGNSTFVFIDTEGKRIGKVELNE